MDSPSNPDDLRHMTPQQPKHRSPLRKAGHWLRNLLVTLLIAAMAFLVAGVFYDDPRVTGLLGMDSRADPQSDPIARPPVQQTEAAGVARPAGTPPPGLEESDAPLGVPELQSVTSQSYKFLVVNDDGSPVGYSPCRPLHYVVNETLAPEGAAHLVHDAIRTIDSATGITFVHDGETAEEPSDERDPYQPAMYGDRWAPLLISWTTPDAAPKLKGQVIGTGGSTHYSFSGGPKTFVTGSLELDAAQIDLELERPDGAEYATAVILHELGHVMGLEHVDDPLQLMYPEIGTPDGLAAGDLSGLRELGQTQCRKDL